MHAVLAFAPVASAAPLLIANAGFEQSDPSNLPAHWQVDAWGSGARVALTGRRAPAGRNCLLIESTVPNDVRLVQVVAVRPQTIYRFRAWVATEQVSAGGIGANLCLLGTEIHSDGATGDTDWHPVDLVFRTDAAQTEVTLAVRLGFYGSVATGRALFDDLSLVELTNPGVRYQQVGPSVLMGAAADSGPAAGAPAAVRAVRRWMQAAAALVLLGLFALAGLVVFRGNQPVRPTAVVDVPAPPGGPAATARPLSPAGNTPSARWFAGVATAVFAVLLTVTMTRHEMWRDEIQAWLLARDTPRWWGIFSTIKYEGHPGLWHFLLWPLTRLTWNPAAMQVLHAALATTTAWLILRRAPFHWAVRLLLPFGYFLFYEWGVISRDYALSALLFVIFCVAFERRWHAFPWAALALAAACHTNVQSLILVIALAPMLAAEYAVAVAGRFRGADQTGRRAVAGFALILLGAVSAVVQIKPPFDSALAPEWNTGWDPERAQAVAASFADAYAPVPAAQADWWNSFRLAGDGLAGGGRLKLPGTAAPGFMFAVMAGLAVLLLRRPWPMLLWFLGTTGLLTFAYVKYLGFARHFGFHLLWLLVVLWMAHGYEPWRWSSTQVDRVWRRAEAWGANTILAAVGALQIWATFVAVHADWTHAFSASPLAAAWLRDHGYLAGGYCLAGQSGPEVSAVVGHARLPRIRYIAGNRDGSYMIWRGGDDGMISGDPLFRALAAYRAEQGRDLVFLSSEPLDPAFRPPGLREVALFAPPAAADAVWIYVWPRGNDLPAVLPAPDSGSP